MIDLIESQSVAVRFISHDSDSVADDDDDDADEDAAAFWICVNLFKENFVKKQKTTQKQSKVGQILTHLHKFSQKYNEKCIDELWPCFYYLRTLLLKININFFLCDAAASSKKKSGGDVMAQAVYMGGTCVNVKWGDKLRSLFHFFGLSEFDTTLEFPHSRLSFFWDIGGNCSGGEKI